MLPDLTDRVVKVIAATQKIPADTIKPESTFAELKIDSLDAIEIIFALENEFNINIPDDSAKDIKTIADLVNGIQKLVGGDAAIAVG